MINEYLLCPLCGKLPTNYKELNFNTIFNNNNSILDNRVVNNKINYFKYIRIICSNHSINAIINDKNINEDTSFYINDYCLNINYMDSIAQISTSPSMNNSYNHYNVILLNLPLNIELTLDSIQSLIYSYIIFN